MRDFVESVAKRVKGEDYRIDKEIPLTYLLGVVIQRVVMLLRGKCRSIGIGHHRNTVFVGKKVALKCKSKIRIGTSVTIQDKVYIDALSKKGVTLGDRSSIGSGTIIRCSGNYKEIGIGFSMGKNSSLADNCFIGATGGVWIGDDVIGGQNIRFHASNHNFNDVEELIRKQGITARGIYIGNNCWIGAGVVFCDGVTIGDGCVIGANAIVTKDFSANSIIVGGPAKKIGVRGDEYKKDSFDNKTVSSKRWYRKGDDS